MSNLPPSFPTKRSRRVRDAVFVLSLLVWAAAMYVVRRTSISAALTGEARELAIFTEAFEQNLSVSLTVTGFGLQFTGEIVRRTKEPYEGRLIVRERWRARSDTPIMGRPAVFELDSETRWDRGAGGFRAARFRLSVSMGPVEEKFLADVVRTLGSRGRELIVLKDASSGEPISPPILVPRGVDLSAGFMEASRVRPPYVGARWKALAVGLFSRRLEQAEVEIVEEDSVPGSKPVMWGYRAVRRVEKETGRSVEQMTTWYNENGSAMMQTIRVRGLELVLRRIERLAGSDAEWEKMALPEEDDR